MAAISSSSCVRSTVWGCSSGTEQRATHTGALWHTGARACYSRPLVHHLQQEGGGDAVLHPHLSFMDPPMWMRRLILSSNRWMRSRYGEAVGGAGGLCGHGA